MKKFEVGIWNCSWNGWEYLHIEANNKREARMKAKNIYAGSNIIIKYINSN